MRFLSTGLILYIEIYISPQKMVGFAEKSGVLYTFLVMPQKTVGQNYIWMFPVVEMEDLRNSGVDIPVDSVFFSFKDFFTPKRMPTNRCLQLLRQR